MSKNKTEWQKAWLGREMDQEAREARRETKKRKVRENRHAANAALKKGDYDAFELNEWDDLDADDIK